MSIHTLSVISTGEDSSRVGLAVFTSLTRHAVNFQTCCTRGRPHLQYLVNKEISLDGEFLIREYDRGDHSDVSPDAIDVRNAFKNIRGMVLIDFFLWKQSPNLFLTNVSDTYLSQGMAQLKPTLIVFVANFQTPYSSFRLLHDAIEEIEACKAAGGWIMAVLIDPIPNR